LGIAAVLIDFGHLGCPLWSLLGSTNQLIPHALQRASFDLSLMFFGTSEIQSALTADIRSSHSRPLILEFSTEQRAQLLRPFATFAG
jgi:hypothetical protein